MGSIWGNAYRVTTFGESHGPALGCVIDGLPAGVRIDLEHIAARLARRRPGQSAYTTSRAELDAARVLSGVDAQGLSLGTPLCIVVENHDVRSQDYRAAAGIFRPGHADLSTYLKHGTPPQPGGGRASARETIGRVAAAAVAELWLREALPMPPSVVAWVARIGSISTEIEGDSLNPERVEESPLRCPDAEACAAMRATIDAARAEGDTLGGLVRLHADSLPAGLGEPVFDKFEADLAKAMLSLPAARSFEIGSGIAGTYLRGSAHNDPIGTDSKGRFHTKGNNAGGVLGGITNGMPVTLAVGFKAVSTIAKAQDSVTTAGAAAQLDLSGGRHDACVLPRAVPLVEAMFWLTLADHVARQQSFATLRGRGT